MAPDFDDDEGYAPSIADPLDTNDEGGEEVPSVLSNDGGF